MLKQKLPVVLGLILTVACGGAASAQDAKGDAANGHKLYLSVGCYQCHGYAGQGGAAPKLVPVPAFPAMLEQLRHPRNLMPPYEASVLSDQEAVDLHAYVETFPKPRDAKDIKLLQQ